MLEITTLENTTIGQITESFNLAFSDYSLPIVFKEEQFVDKFASEGGRLDLSVGVFDSGVLVGFILHFMNIKQGQSYIYNGGTGVIPTHRGQRLTSKMYDFILPKLKESNIDRLILEVFTDNLSASKIYQNRGFEIQREVACYSGKLIKNGRELSDTHSLVELTNPNWKELSSFWDYPPTWQNSISTINKLLDKLSFIGIQEGNELVGYMIFNPENGRIRHLAVSPKHRNKGVASALLNEVQAMGFEKNSMINVDIRTDGMKSFLEKRGLTNYVNQFEMEMGLS